MVLFKPICAVYSVLWCRKHCSLGSAKPGIKLKFRFSHPRRCGGRSHSESEISLGLSWAASCFSSASAFLHHRDAPPLLPSDTTQGYRTVKAKLGSKKVRPWKWMPFTNPARKDGAMFYHWRRAAEEGKDYPFARFNKVSGSTFKQKRINSSWKIPFGQLLECPDRNLVLSTCEGWVRFGNYILICSAACSRVTSDYDVSKSFKLSGLSMWSELARALCVSGVQSLIW